MWVEGGLILGSGGRGFGVALWSKIADQSIVLGTFGIGTQEVDA